MQTDSAPEQHMHWSEWADFLRHRGLENLAAWLLEAAGPLTALGAQALYFGLPFLRPAVPGNQVEALAHLLEDGDEARQFAAFLREESSA